MVVVELSRHNDFVCEYFAHFPGQRFWRERLLQECQARFQNSVTDDGVIGIAGNIQDLHFRAQRGKVSWPTALRSFPA